MAEIEKKVEDLSLNASADAADKAQGKPKEKKPKKPAVEGAYPLEVRRNAHNIRHIAPHIPPIVVSVKENRSRNGMEKLCRYCH